MKRLREEVMRRPIEWLGDLTRLPTGVLARIEEGTLSPVAELVSDPPVWTLRHFSALYSLARLVEQLTSLVEADERETGGPADAEVAS
jgi:hypothetical protein